MLGNARIFEKIWNQNKGIQIISVLRGVPWDHEGVHLSLRGEDTETSPGLGLPPWLQCNKNVCCCPNHNKKRGCPVLYNINCKPQFYCTLTTSCMAIKTRWLREMWHFSVTEEVRNSQAFLRAQHIRKCIPSRNAAGSCLTLYK